MAGTMAALILLWPAAALMAADSAGVEFFENRIRPLLAEHCYECHSAAGKQKGGLRLDTRDALLKGGGTGPAIAPGNPDQSLLMKAVRYTDEHLQMPPKGKRLPATHVADLEAWIRMGAPDPRTNNAAGRASAGVPDATRHWAFQPVRFPTPPAPRNSGGARNPIDLFLQARLESQGLSLSPPADPRTRLRRVHHTLTGLPPTPAEVEAFAADPSPAAYATVVERLLASTAYGERWARHWLDVARYADTKGYVFEEERRYSFAWTYRDWVVRALNADLPFDQFVVEQIAADRLPSGGDKSSLAALGFLTLGRRFLNNTPDIIDDRIDVVSRGLMGLTLGCARCHDHKFDPLTMKDYYGLYGVFNSSHEPGEKPLLGGSARPKEYAAYLAEKQKRETELKDYDQARRDEARAKLRDQAGEFLFTAHRARQLPEDRQDPFSREQKLDPGTTRQWIRALQRWEKEPGPIWGPWVRFAALSTNEFAARAAGIVDGWKTNPPAGVNSWILRAFTNAPAPVSLKDVAARYGAVLKAVDREWQALSRANTNPASPPKALASADAEALRQVLYAADSPAHPGGDTFRLLETPAQQRIRALRRKVEELDALHPGAPPRAMAMADNARPTEPVIFLRGNANNPGPRTARAFPAVLAGPRPQPFTNGSGRLELAQAIASTNNPLTARVLVNRVWQQHFGTPLVRTPGDFGLQADPPTHPELLDYLAARFMADGWSLKQLHRLLVTSAAFQQASDDTAAGTAADPNNELYWRMNRHRLDFEALRDTLLAVSGRLDRTPGGPSSDITTEPFSTRRTVYAYIERQNLPGLFRTFDFASPDTTSPQRFKTTVPQQALFLLNSPFVVEQARALAARPELRDLPADERVNRLYELAFQRPPEPAELALAREFLKSQEILPGLELETPRWRYGYGAVDTATGKVRFHELPHFTGAAWQGGPALPDPKLGWVMLDATGGHPDQANAVIRRWTAPRDGTIRVEGRARHPGESGDGVRCRIISNRSGMAGEWVARQGRVNTTVESLAVKQGDTVDFVTDVRAEPHSDTFLWAPRIFYTGSSGSMAARGGSEWSAKDDFKGPAGKRPLVLTPWERYAQVLLLANELAFVD